MEIESAIKKVLDCVVIELERVEGRSPTRILPFFETVYALSLPGLDEYISFPGKPYYQYCRDSSDVIRERREGAVVVTRLINLCKAMENYNAPVYKVMKSLFMLIYSVGECARADFFKFLAILKVFVATEKWIVAQMLYLFMNPPRSKKDAEDRVACLFKGLNMERTREATLGDYLGYLASQGSIRMSGFSSTDLFFGVNGNGVMVSTPTTFTDFISRTTFQPHGPSISNVACVDGDWKDLLAAGILRPRVYEKFDCSQYIEKAMLLAQSGYTHEDLRKESKKCDKSGDYEAALQYRVYADVLLCCEKNTSMVDTGLLLTWNEQKQRTFDHESAIQYLLEKINKK